MDTPELATLENDFWTLESGFDRHVKNPNGFWIPDEEQRLTLDKGAAAKLIFLLEGEDDDGESRVWVIVLGSRYGYYLGILGSDPDCLESEDGVLQRGSKLWFKPAHIIDIGHPPLEYLKANCPDELAT